MNARAGSGWQTVLADLSLILFMVTAAAVSQAPPEAAVKPLSPVPALGEPVAVWRGEPGAPPLAQWLALAGADPLLRLTIIAPAREAAAAQALAATAGRPARIVLEAEAGGPVLAALTYDQAVPLARGLQGEAANQPPSEAP
jgi:hypothetical protein